MDPTPAQQRCHDEAVRQGRPGYLDPETGLLVLTARYLAGKAACCGSGCRHCPWPPEEQARAGRPGATRGP